MDRPGARYIVYRKDAEFYHFRYSPFVALTMFPLGRITPPGNALIIWYALLNIAFFMSLWLMANQLNVDFGLSREHRYLILWGTLLMSLRFYLINISLGQTDILVAFLFVVFLIAYIRNSEILCGILLAIILQFKLFFLPILVYFLLTARIKIFLSTVTGFFCLLFAPAYMLGIEKTMGLLRDWIDVLGMSVPSQILNIKNQSLSYSIYNLLLKINYVKGLFTSPQYLFYLISCMSTLLAYIIMVWSRKYWVKRDGKRYRYLEVSLLIIVSLLFSAIAWKSYFINLIIPLGVTIYFTMEAAKKKLLYAALGLFFILSCVVGTDLTKYVPGINELNIVNIAIGTVFLVIALVYAFRQSSRTLAVNVS